MTVEAASPLEHAESGAPVALSPVADAVASSLMEVSKTNATITELAQLGQELSLRYANVVADVRTTKGYEQVAAIRTELREKVRYPMQRLQEAGSKMLGTMQRQFNVRAKELIAEAEALEEPFQLQLDVEDARKAAEKAERDAAEQRRKDGHTESIAAIQRIPADTLGMPSEVIERVLAATRELIVDDSYEEFQGQAMQAKYQAIADLNGMLVAERAEEQERIELAAARERARELAVQQEEARVAAEAKAAEERAAREAADAENQKLRDQLAAMQKAEADRQAEAERQREENERATRERAAAIEMRLTLLRTTGAAYSHMAPSGNIKKALEELQAIDLTADQFGDRIEEAKQDKDVAIGNLREVLAGAVAREVEEAAAAQRARREELLANIVGMGESALLAVQDGSAEVTLLEEQLQNLRDLDMGLDVWGDHQMLQAAMEAQAHSVKNAENAIINTKERDRLRAEEEERENQRRAALRNQMMREQLMRDNAILLFPAAAALVEFIEESGCVHIAAGPSVEGTFNRLTDDVRNILRRIPKE